MRATGEEPSLGQLFSELSEQASTLVREEVALAKTELTDSAKRAGKGVGFMAAAAALGYAGLLSLIATFIILLAQVVRLPVAAIVVTGIVIATALILFQIGRTEMTKRSLAPKHTIASIREDVQWAKSETR